ncbi:MAG: response regulator [bacterium]
MREKTSILLVDDDISFTDSLSDILNEKGYSTSTANNGIDALKKIEEEDFDVIFLDIQMPVMNGVEVYKRIKKIKPQLAVIMMTAFSMEDLIKDALREGAYGILYKPLDVDRVMGMIETVKKGGAFIMIVDDDAHLRESLGDILKNKGYVVTLACDGEEAIQIAKEIPLDILFIDIKLPNTNGFETYLAIRRINPHIVGVLMTAYHQEMGDLIEEALQNNVYTCLYKPFPPKKMLHLIRSIIVKRKQSL